MCRSRGQATRGLTGHPTVKDRFTRSIRYSRGCRPSVATEMLALLRIELRVRSGVDEFLLAAAHGRPYKGRHCFFPPTGRPSVTRCNH